MVSERIIATNGPLSLVLDDETNLQGHVEGENGFVGPVHSIYSVLARPGWELLPRKITIPIKVKGGAGSGNWGHAGRPGLVGGSASTSAGAVPEGELQVKHDMEGVTRSDFNEWPHGAFSIAIDALSLVENVGRKYKPIALYDKGELVNLAAYALNEPEAKLYLASLASKHAGRGYGTKMMIEVCKVASQNGMGIQLDSVMGARGFYARIGMRLVEGYANKYELSAEEVNGFISRVSGS